MFPEGVGRRQVPQVTERAVIFPAFFPVCEIPHRPVRFGCMLSPSNKHRFE